MAWGGVQGTPVYLARSAESTAMINGDTDVTARSPLHSMYVFLNVLTIM